MSEPILPLSRLQGACGPQLEIVRREWPNGIPLTEATAARVVELRLDLEWAAAQLLAAPAYAEWKRATAPAYAEWKRATAPARAEWKRATAAADAEWERAAAPACAEWEWERATAPARAELARATAAALLHLLLKTGDFQPATEGGQPQ